MAEMRPYVVRQGESLATLAQRHDFDMDSVWQDSANEDLRSRRSDPCVLAPFDIVHLPVPKPKWLPVTIGQENVFTGSVRTLHARMRFTDAAGAPIAGAAYEIPDLDPPQSGQTAADGGIDLEVPFDVTMVRIRFVEAGVDVVAHVGHLDPVEEPSGLEQRLSALQLIPPLPAVLDEEAQAVVRAEHRRAALVAFQRANGLDPTGALDDATASALARAHGA